VNCGGWGILVVVGWWVMGIFCVGECRRDASGMEGSDGGDEGGGGAARPAASVGHGGRDLHSRARRRIAQRGARECAAAVSLRGRLQRCDRVDVHPPRHVVPDGVRPPHACASHQQVRPLPSLASMSANSISVFSQSLFVRRVIPHRHQQPEMYKMYLELTSTFAFSLSSTKIMPCRDRYLHFHLFIGAVRVCSYGF
jgi:hypothetical protein